MTASRKTNTKQETDKRGDCRSGVKFNRDELIELSLEAIEKHNLMFTCEIIAYLDCSERTFYNYELQHLQPLKEALTNNRTRRKIQLREKWYQSDNPITQIALFKLIGTDEEVERLGSNRQTPRLPEGDKLLRVTFSLNPNKENAVRRNNKLLTEGEPLDDSIDGEIVDDAGD
jgi:hypothetical protein